MKWCDIFFEPINLPVIGSDPALIADADCENCMYSRYVNEDYQDNHHCYMFEFSPGNKCGQFKKVKK